MTYFGVGVLVLALGLPYLDLTTTLVYVASIAILFLLAVMMTDQPIQYQHLPLELTLTLVALGICLTLFISFCWTAMDIRGEDSLLVLAASLYLEYRVHFILTSIVLLAGMTFSVSLLQLQSHSPADVGIGTLDQVTRY